MWQAKNVPNDELDLQVPIWDTDICYYENGKMAVCTAYGDVREYDLKQRKPTQNTKVYNDNMLLSKIHKSRLNNNIFFVTNKEGHIAMLDRRQSKFYSPNVYRLQDSKEDAR